MRGIESPGMARSAILLGLLCSMIASHGAESAAENTYLIDQSSSEITVILTQEGLIARLRPIHTVSVKKFSGRVELPPENETRGSVVLKAEAGSLENIDKNMGEIEKREFHSILHKTVLETEKFPSIEFQSVSITNLSRNGDDRNFTLNGKLTLRGVTKNVSLPVKVALSDGRLRATGEGRFRQTEFGITPYTGGFGTIKIGDEVKVGFDVVANAKGVSAKGR